MALESDADIAVREIAEPGFEARLTFGIDDGLAVLSHEYLVSHDAAERGRLEFRLGHGESGKLWKRFG